MRLLTSAVLGVILSAAPARAERTVYLQPLGEALPDADVAIVVTALVELYQVDVKILPRVPLPQAAWYPPRKRWRAEKILSFIAPRMPEDGMRILGLTAADISTTKGEVVDWGVLGLGDLEGPAGVISTFRCHKKARDDLHARQRLAKVAVHEVGHTLGLPHCPTDGCLMHDAEGKVVTTDGEYDLCSRCRAKLALSGRKLRDAPALPWPKP